MRKILCIILIISLLSCNICIYAEEGANNQEQETNEKNIIDTDAISAAGFMNYAKKQK